MLELPEIATIRDQLLNVIVGKKVEELFAIANAKIEDTVRSSLVTQTESELRKALVGQVVHDITSMYNSIRIYFDNERVLFFGAVYGRILFCRPEQPRPKNKCFSIVFSDKSCLSASMNLFGSVRVMTRDESENQIPDFLRGALDPDSNDFTWDAFREVIDSRPEVPKLSVKKFVTSCLPTYIGGIGNGYLQEILFRAKIHPKRKMATLSRDEQRRYYSSIRSVVREAIKMGGRNSERDLFGSYGKFVPSLSKDTVGQPCPRCGTTIIKFAFEGGSCYICPDCQRM